MRDPFLMLALAEGFGESPVPALLAPDLDVAALVAAFESASATDRAQVAALASLPPRALRRLAAPDLAAQAATLRRRAQELGLAVRTPADADWPARLSAQPQRPLVLFARGDVGALGGEPAVAVVGSRTPTPYGRDAAGELGAALARSGATIWSGLARGIDAIAHEAALAAQVPTVAVLAGGLDAIYPPEHRPLAERIVAAGGCLVSELPPGRRARRGHFVRRNRLLAAGPRAVVVVEGSLASGALHTARFGAECDTDVFALPGPWRSERSQGCHRLIAEGAGIVESCEGLLQSLGLGAHASPAALHRLATNADEAAVLARLRDGPRPTDLLRRESGLDAAAFRRALFALEGQGAIARLPGDLWRRASGPGAPGPPLTTR